MARHRSPGNVVLFWSLSGLHPSAAIPLSETDRRENYWMGKLPKQLIRAEGIGFSLACRIDSPHLAGSPSLWRIALDQSHPKQARHGNSLPAELSREERTWKEWVSGLQERKFHGLLPQPETILDGLPTNFFTFRQVRDLLSTLDPSTPLHEALNESLSQELFKTPNRSGAVSTTSELQAWWKAGIHPLAASIQPEEREHPLDCDETEGYPFPAMNSL